MLINGRLIAAQQKLPVFGASLDGTNDYLTRGAALTGVVDGKIGIFAARIRMLGGDGVAQRIVSNRDASILRFIISRQTTNVINIFGRTTANVTTLHLDSVATITADGSYHNILASWDVENDDNHIYIDDISSLSTRTSDNANIDYTSTEFAVGADAITGGLNKINADIDVIYLNLAETMDFSIVANRRKYFDSAGKWVPSRLDGGQEPTGNQPPIYMCNTYRGFSANQGSGGGFQVTGALTESA